MANQQRAVLTESLLDDNITEDCGRTGNVGAGCLPNLAASSVTTILVLSALVNACIAFGFGNAVKLQILRKSEISQLFKGWTYFSLIVFAGGIFITYSVWNHGRLGSFCSRVFTLWFIADNWSNAWCSNMWEDNRSSWSQRHYVDFEFVLYWWWLAIAFTKVHWLLDLGRFALGSRNGIAGFLMPIYVAEVAPKNLRGRISALGTLMVCWGLSFMYVVGSFVNWRTLALIATIPGLLQLPLLFLIPESPRWLAKVGRQKDLEAALQSLRGDKVDISKGATEIKDYTESLQSASKGSILDVFEQKYTRPLLIFVGLLILQSLGGITAISYYSGAIFPSAGISSIIGLVTLAVVQDFNWWDQGAPIFALVGVLLLMASYTLAAGMTWLLVSEVFPVNIKGSAGSICNLISNASNWLVAYFFNFLIQWSSAGIFFIFSAFSGASFLVAAIMVPETKRTNSGRNTGINVQSFSGMSEILGSHCI